jgi:tetratricopeptide (TPR) repeat protein
MKSILRAGLAIGLLMVVGCRPSPLSVPPDAVRALARAKVLMASGLFDRAIAECNRAIEVAPNYALAYNDRGLAHTKRARLRVAIADFDRAIQLDPTLAVAYFNRGLAYAKAGRQAEADEDFAQAKRLGYQGK